MGERLDTVLRAAGALVDDVRARVAAGREPDPDAATRLRALFAEARDGDSSDDAAVVRAEQHALAQLERVLSVHRARSLLADRPAPAAASTPNRRAALRSRPTITGNMEIRRERTGDAYLLAWDAAPAVSEWEIRFSERRTARDDYALKEERSLPAGSTQMEVPLGEGPLRVHVLGRGRNGRLLRRAVLSALSRETWDARWQRRGS